MNNYTLLANSYRYLMEQGEIDKSTAEKEIRIYEFLSGCDEDDLCIMVDSSAFNDIIRAYLKKAVMSAELDKKAQKEVLDQLPWIFDTMQAKDVLKQKNE